MTKVPASHVHGLYPWPHDGQLSPGNTAVIVLGMQRDYADPQGWMACRGDDLGMIRAIVPGLAQLLSVMHRAGLPVAHVREAHQPTLSDLPANKRWRSARAGAEIGTPGPLGRHLVAGQDGTRILSDLAVHPGDDVIDTPGKSGFFASPLDQCLRSRGPRNLVLCGATTDGLVQATLRDANDRGYECLVLSDLCATTDAGLHEEQIRMFSLAGGLWGSVATSADLLAALEPLE